MLFTLFFLLIERSCCRYARYAPSAAAMRYARQYSVDMPLLVSSMPLAAATPLRCRCPDAATPFPAVAALTLFAS